MARHMADKLQLKARAMLTSKLAMVGEPYAGTSCAG